MDKFALTNAIYNMDAAYQKFFKEHAGYPKFKSKHDNHKSYTTNFTNGNITESVCEINTAEEPQTKEESEGWPGSAGEVSAILDSLKMFDNL